MNDKESLAAFNLVEFAAHYQKGFRNNVIPLSEVPNAVKRFRNFECYSSYFVFNDEIKLYMKNNLREGHPSVAGYPGAVWAYLLPIDIDPPSSRPSQGLDTAKALVGFLQDYLDLDKTSLMVYASGAGYHLMLSSQKFGATPRSDLHLVFGELRSRLIKVSKLKRTDSIDLSIRDKNRLWRLPGTINKKTGLFKTQLELEELKRLGLEEIKELSRQAKPTRYTDSTGLIPTSKIGPNPLGEALYYEAIEGLEKKSKKKIRPSVVVKEASDPIETLCEARKRIWDTGVPEGQRNNAGIRLASWFRICGNSKEETEALLKLWNRKNGIGLEEEELEHVVSSAYTAAEPYAYF